MTLHQIASRNPLAAPQSRTAAAPVAPQPAPARFADMLSRASETGEHVRRFDELNWVAQAQADTSAAQGDAICAQDSRALLADTPTAGDLSRPLPLDLMERSSHAWIAGRAAMQEGLDQAHTTQSRGPDAGQNIIPGLLSSSTVQADGPEASTMERASARPAPRPRTLPENASTSPFRVTLLSTASGLQIFARTPALDAQERMRLRNAIQSLTAAFGVTDTELILREYPPASPDRARQSSHRGS